LALDPEKIASSESVDSKQLFCVYTEAADSIDVVRSFTIVVPFKCRSSCCCDPCGSWPPISDASARDDNRDPPATAFISEEVDEESTFDLVFIEFVLDLAEEDLLESVLVRPIELESGSGGVTGTPSVHPAEEENLDILLAIEYREYR
jgi:hypothetical protein